METAVIIDEQPYIRLIVGRILQEEGIKVIAECGDGLQGLAQARQQQPDLVVLELALPGMEGLDVIDRLCRCETPPKVVVLTASPAEYTLERCRHAGASAFIPKGNDLESFRKGVRAVQAGFTCFPDLSGRCRKVSRTDIDERTRLASLSARELAVLRYLAVGYSNMQIGQAMLLSNKTISSYKTRLVNKLKVTSVVRLAELAKRNGLV